MSTCHSTTYQPLSYLFAIVLLLALASSGMAEESTWPQFRGHSHSDQHPDENAKIPLAFSVDEGQEKNLSWQADLPGRGPSSPIVAGGRVIVTASGGREQSELHTIAFDSGTGSKLWQRTLYATGRTLTHATSANAAPTPATDGEYIIAFYSSNDVICYDMDGNLKWYRGLGLDYPKVGNDIGMASSPLIVDSVVVVQAESQGDSFAIGLDIETGKNIWKIARKREGSWSSPAIFHDADGTKLVLLQSGDVVSAVAPATGEEKWRLETECNRIPSPLAVGNRVFVASEGLSAFEVEGDEPDLLWQSGKLAPGSPSPVFHDGKIYVVKRNGILNCADANDGQILWKLRLGTDSQWATPVIAGNHMVCVGTNGKVAIVNIVTEKEIASPDLGQTITASPALADNAIYIRSDARLWKFAAEGN